MKAGTEAAWVPGRRGEPHVFADENGCTFAEAWIESKTSRLAFDRRNISGEEIQDGVWNLTVDGQWWGTVARVLGTQSSLFVVVGPGGPLPFVPESSGFRVSIGGQHVLRTFDPWKDSWRKRRVTTIVEVLSPTSLAQEPALLLALVIPPAQFISTQPSMY